MLSKTQIILIAIACHNVNKAYCESIGDTTQKSWDEAEQWQRDSAIAGVEFRLKNPTAKEDAYSMKGAIIKKFPSIACATAITGIRRRSIQENISGRNKSAGGYIFKYDKQLQLCLQ